MFSLLLYNPFYLFNYNHSCRSLEDILLVGNIKYVKIIFPLVYSWILFKPISRLRTQKRMSRTTSMMEVLTLETVCGD